MEGREDGMVGSWAGGGLGGGGGDGWVGGKTSGGIWVCWQCSGEAPVQVACESDVEQEVDPVVECVSGVQLEDEGVVHFLKHLRCAMQAARGIEPL